MDSFAQKKSATPRKVRTKTIDRIDSLFASRAVASGQTPRQAAANAAAVCTSLQFDERRLASAYCCSLAGHKRWRRFTRLRRETRSLHEAASRQVERRRWRRRAVEWRKERRAKKRPVDVKSERRWSPLAAAVRRCRRRRSLGRRLMPALVFAGRKMCDGAGERRVCALCFCGAWRAAATPTARALQLFSSFLSCRRARDQVCAATLSDRRFGLHRDPQRSPFWRAHAAFKSQRRWQPH